MGKSKRQRSESKKVFSVQVSARAEVEIKDRYKAHGAGCTVHLHTLLVKPLGTLVNK